jgi:hypothetical protein
VSVAKSDPDPSLPQAPTAGDAIAPAVPGVVDLHALAPLAAWTRTTRGERTFQDVCATAGVAPDAFSNGGGLVPQAQLESWLSALRDCIGGDGALLAAGMASETPPASPRRWLQWIATAALLYRSRAGQAWLTAGAGRIAVRSRGLGAAIVRYSTVEPQSRVVCLWRHARLGQRTRTWGLPPAIVRELRCLARGDDACEYVIHWEARPRWTAAVLATATTVGGLAWLSPEAIGAWVLPVIVASVAHAIEVERVRRANRATDDAFALAFRRATSSAPARPAATDQEIAADTAPSAAAPEEAPSVKREGDFWRICFASKTVLIRHSRGLSLLVHLLRNPGEEIHVSALDASSPSDAAVPVADNAPVDAPIGDLGDAGEILDAQAKATYRRRLGELREEIEEAEANNDIGRVESLRAELDALTDQLRQATGLGGRSRRAASNADRVRVAVTRRIRAAIVQIEKHHPPLGAHLTETIHTGYFCSYGPGGVTWQE